MQTSGKRENAQATNEQFALSPLLDWNKDSAENGFAVGCEGVECNEDTAGGGATTGTAWWGATLGAEGVAVEVVGVYKGDANEL